MPLMFIVPHQSLLHELDHYGTWGTTINWIENFVTGRTHKVVVDGSSSESVRVKSGVPPGYCSQTLTLFSRY